ncbi:MAG: hypothetical protein AAF899_02850 [Pseudomonadota bacterium]
MTQQRPQSGVLLCKPALVPALAAAIALSISPVVSVPSARAGDLSLSLAARVSQVAAPRRAALPVSVGTDAVDAPAAEAGIPDEAAESLLTPPRHAVGAYRLILLAAGLGNWRLAEALLTVWRAAQPQGLRSGGRPAAHELAAFPAGEADPG